MSSLPLRLWHPELFKANLRDVEYGPEPKAPSKLLKTLLKPQS
jgi:hypothetical protein